MVGSHSVLIVEDEHDIADTFEAWLQDQYSVQTAHDGRTALDQLDESVDVVLLDRRLPDRSGREICSEIRRRGVDCRVAMITAVEPEVDVVDVAFDDYLVEPIERADLHDLLDRLLTDHVDDTLSEYYALATKKAMLDTELTQDERDGSADYADLEARLEDVRREADDAIDNAIIQHDFATLLDSLTTVDTADEETEEATSQII